MRESSADGKGEGRAWKGRPPAGGDEKNISEVSSGVQNAAVCSHIQPNHKKSAWHCQVEVQNYVTGRAKPCRTVLLQTGRAVCVEAINAVIRNKGLLRRQRQRGKAQPSVPGSGAEPAAHERRAGTHRDRPDETAL